MKIKSISGLLFFVSDLDTTIKFYDKLGFRMGKRGDDHVTVYINWFWVEFRQADETHQPHGNKIHPTQSTYVAVEDVDEAYKTLKADGFKPIAEPRTYDSGRREVMITDPDGYLLVFFQKV